jgi:hypothetical protein
MKIPGGHQKIMPYLIAEGSEKFIEFTSNVFEAKEIYKAMAGMEKALCMPKFKSTEALLCLPTQRSNTKQGRWSFSFMLKMLM